MGVGQQPPHALLILWLAAMLTPNIVLRANPSFLRAAGGIVPAYLITAIGLDGVYAWIVRRWPNQSHSWLSVLAVSGILLTLASSWHSYFDVWKKKRASSVGLPS